MAGPGAGSSGGRRRTSEEVRARVLEAAREVFDARGFEGAATRDIAARAGVAPTAIFRHFTSKQGLHDAVTGRAAGTPGTPGPPPASGGADARGQLVAAARELFAARGYAGTSTREVARAAGVHETYVFRYFGSKAGLFREAILEPFGSFVRDFGTDLSESGRVSLADGSFVDGLLEVLRSRRQELLTLVATRLHEGPDVVEVADQRDAMREVLDPLAARVAARAAGSGADQEPGLDAAIATRLTVAMIGGVAIFEDWLFDAVTEADLSGQMRSYVARALGSEHHQQGAGAPDRDDPGPEQDALGGPGVA